jgi:hypothetical protein
MTTQLEKILVCVVGALILAITIVVWWHLHNAGERKLGAQACIAATTETKVEVVARNQADESGQADDLKATVADQNEKLSKLSADNADLIGRLHRDTLHGSPVPNTGGAACPDLNAGALRAGQGDLKQIEPAEVAVLNDCDAEHERANAAVSAYNDWRQRMIERSQKTPASVSVR